MIINDNPIRMIALKSEDNLSARKFYENNGFVASGKTCLIEGTTKTDMCYELIL